MDPGKSGEGRLVLSIILNLLITVVELVGGVISGSLALISDALHNFSDTTSLVVSLVTLRISRRRPDSRRTYGYRRAQILGAFINLVTLVLIALYLIYEAVERYLDPQPIDGPVMLGVALFGLAANLLTAFLLFRHARHSLNIRSAFIHIVSDAVSSVGVVLGGLLIILYDLFIVDVILTVLISVYILIHSAGLLRQTARILMQSAPAGFEYERLLSEVREVEGVEDVHHVHVWQLDENHTSLEAHIIINKHDFEEMGRIKDAIKRRLSATFNISHSTLEFEFVRCEACEDERCYEDERRPQ
jgi:cobalt-zinc-cadmium efflux system protein